MEEMRVLIHRKIDDLRRMLVLVDEMQGDQSLRDLGMKAALEVILKNHDPLSVQEIADALRAGGFVSRSKNFVGIVQSGLKDYAKDLGATRISRGRWTIAEQEADEDSDRPIENADRP